MICRQFCLPVENCACMTESKKSCIEFELDVSIFRSKQCFTKECLPITVSKFCITVCQNVTYPAGECTFIDSPNGDPWCRTEQGSNGLDDWDYCNKNCGR